MLRTTLLAALVGVSAAGFSQTVIFDDFESGPANDGRDGWVHNFNRPGDNYARANLQGDLFSRVFWAQNRLVVQDAAQGQTDRVVAPSRFIVNGGDFNALTSATITYTTGRLTPSTAIATGSTEQRPASIRLYNAAGDFVESFYHRADWIQYATTQLLPADFYNAVDPNIAYPISFDLKDFSKWDFSGNPADVATTTVNERAATQLQFESVMSNVVEIVIDVEYVSGSDQNWIDDIALNYTTASGTQLVKSDFNTAADDAFAGWRHNRNQAPNFFLGALQGDAGGQLEWVSTIIEDLEDGLVTRGLLRVLDGAQGAGDRMVAPARYVPLNGRFDFFAPGSILEFDYVRFSPGAVTAANQITLEVTLTSGTSFAHRIYSVAELSALQTWAALSSTFFDQSGVLKNWPIVADFNDRSKWTVGRVGTTQPQKSLEEIFATVENLMIDGEVVNGREINGVDFVRLSYIERAKLNCTFSFSDRSDRFPAGAVVQFRNPNDDSVAWSAWAKFDIASGTFVLPQAAPSGTYNLTVDPGLSYMRRTILGVNNPGTDVDGPNFVFINGDVNDDQIVDGNDVNAVLAVFGAEEGAAEYNTTVDVNGDGIIDGNDINVILSNFGAEGDA